jgi:hypothetical protein
VVKYSETAHANQAFSMLTALNNVQNNAKVKHATKMREHVWSANMGSMAIPVKKIVLETVKKDV